MEKLKLVDKKIIYELESNSRQSLSKVSRNIKTSQQVVSYRIKNLEKNKIILKYITIIDYTKLGCKNVVLGIKLKNILNEDKKKLINWLKEEEKVNYVVETQNKFSLVVMILYKQEKDILDFIYKLKNDYFHILNSYKIFYIIEKKLYNKDYFFKKYRNIKQEIVIKDKQETNIDDLEKSILNQLSCNSKIGTTTLAKKNKTTPEIIVKKIKNLNKQKIILGYRMFLNLKEKSFFVFIKLKNGKNKELFDYLKNLKNVVMILKTIGEHEIIVKYESSHKNIYKQVKEIKQKFYETIDEIDVEPIYAEKKMKCVI